MNTKQFWLDALERAVKTFAQALLATMVVGGNILNISAVDLKSSLGVALGAALISVLTSLVSSQLGGTSSNASALPVKYQPVDKVSAPLPINVTNAATNPNYTLTYVSPSVSALPVKKQEDDESMPENTAQQDQEQEQDNKL